MSKELKDLSTKEDQDKFEAAIGSSHPIGKMVHDSYHLMECDHGVPYEGNSGCWMCDDEP